MNRCDRETAAAFGEFGAASARVQINAPKVSVAAPPKLAVVKPPAATFMAPLVRSAAVQAVASVLAKPVARPVAAKPVVVSPGLSAPTAAQKQAASNQFSQPAAAAFVASGAGKDVIRAPLASTAQTGNFIEASAKPLVAPSVAVQAPKRTAAQEAARLKGLEATAAAKRRQIEEQRQIANAKVAAQRAADAKIDAKIHADLMANNPAYAAREKYIHSAGLDTAQITMGAKVLATGAAIIASGGAVAGAVGLTAGGAALASAAAADRLVAAVEKGGELAKKAKGVVDDVKAAAAKGDAIAKQALGTLNDVAAARIDKLIPPGLEQVLTLSGAAAANAVAGAIASQPALPAAVMAAAAASLPSSSGYMTLTAGRRPTVASSRPRIDIALAPLSLVWFVSDAGKVTRVASGKAPSGGGFKVYANGKVVEQ